MTTLREAATMALEALELVTELTNHDDEIYEAITALRAALAQQAEPVDCDGCAEVCQRAKVCALCAGELTRLAQQAEPVEQMPVGWLESPHGAFRADPLYKMQFPSQLLQWQIALYTAPPQRQPLTSDKDRPDQGTTYVEGYGYVDTRAVRAVERAHGIGGDA